MKKKILVVSQYFFPEQFRINDICSQWVKRGYDVTVLTGIPNYPQGDYYEGYSLLKKRKETYNGMNIVRLPLIPRKKNSVMLGMNYLSFVVSGEMWKIFHREKFDAVFIYEVSPMTQALPAVRYAKKMGIPCYIYVMDLWPENFQIITGITNKFIINHINKMTDYIYRHCNKIFTASKSFRNNIINRGVNESKVIFWPQYAENFYKPVQETLNLIPDDDRLKITFAGNVGIAQGLEILPDVALKLKKMNLKVLFVLVGDGRFKPELKVKVEEKEVENYFLFLDPIPATDIPKLMNSSDFSLVSLKKDDIFQMTIPAKLQSSMACGAPILLWADGEAQQVVIEAQSGLVSPAGDVEKAFDSVNAALRLDKGQLKHMGENSRRYYETKYERKYLLDMMDKYFNEEI